MEKVNSITLEETYSRVNGRTINPMVMGSTCTKMGLSMREYGKMICSMVMVRRNGLMGLVTRASISRARNAARASIFGPMVVGMRETGWIIRLLVG